MADVSYSDVQRAVQDSIRNIEADVQRLTANVNNITSQIQALSDIARDIQTLRQNLQQNLGTQTDALSFNSAPNMNQIEQNITSMQTDVQDLKNRFSNLESYLQQRSN